VGGPKVSTGRDRTQLGQWGEDLVAQYLQERGCTMVASRWRCRLGEIDLIAADGKYLRLVEVKLRKNANFSAAREAVDARKQEKLRRTAALYLQQRPTRLQPRFDVAEVYAPAGMETVHPQIHYLEDAF